MDDKTKKLKALIKNATPKETFGTDPLDPWSAKAGITEDESMLNAYLRSRGINPNFVSKETKISHAKSSAFMKWQHDHQFESVEVNEVSSDLLDRYKEKAKKSAEELTVKGQHKQSTDRWANIMKATGKQIEKTTANIRKALRKEEVDKEDTITFDIPLLIRMLEYAREDAKDDMDLHKVTEKLISIRDKGTLTMADYDFITKLKEEVEFDEAWNQPDYSQSIKARQAAADKKVDVQKKKPDENKTKTNEEINSEKERKKSAWTKVAQARSEIWRRKQIKVNEEQLDELKKSTLASYVKKAHKDATYHSNAAGFVAGVKQPKYNTSDDTPQEKKREKGIERALDKLTKEDTYQDTYAATQTVFDGGNNPDDTEIKKRELSKSARIIKSIYKRKGVVKEDTYDWEKEDKSVESYGKKPKMVTDKKDSFGDNKPEAAIIMKGGKTLTGVERDMIEIDPLLKTRPNQVMNQVVNTSKK